MAHFGKINLAALSSHKIAEFPVKGSDEKIKCIVLPIDKNNLFLSDKGNVYLDIVAFELKSPTVDKDGAVTQTHLVKQSLPKKVRDAMSKDEQMNQPIIGSMAILDNSGFEKPAEQDTSFTASADAGGDIPF